ncbi:UDP-N-acetylmuramate--L-alanine ligase [Occultella glacieicola]|uniref:UDP-N-acetylmuramate--L-alanine ligase n=1 Tax=Occultella glacieicola TaxID=2518684 RepID=A0ABY2E0N1_9MICO|nr:UDP-N-acetylmuramate--L-alanine ligase [Occultella glacieicola]TDE90822.1 UDP-N-acetylmuramate--L-alanine ligase [Occultella glacieicola]
MRVHFIAIGGAGMSVVAELMLARGHEVSGSDSQASDVLDRLGRLGAQVHVGHDPAHAAGADLVVVSSAIRTDNPELLAAHAAGTEVIHRSQGLALAAADTDFVAVAGAHGKTTTSSMLAVALREAGLDPSFAIGGRVLALGTGAHLGTGTVFVAEADESDGSFLNYTPRVAVVTNIEPDHLDHYGTADAFEAAFDDFAARVRPGGAVVACADDDGARRFTERARSRGARVITYGLADDADVRITGVDLGAGSSSSRLRAAAGEFELDLAVPGAHNVANATAAWAAGVELGVDPATMANSLGTFSGTARRFEDKGTAAGVRVVDDYAHNPTKVAAAVATGRRAVGAGRLLVLFQPHLFSRTEAFAAEFADALAGADEVVLTLIYPAREDPRPGVTSALIADRLPGARYLPDHLEAAHAVAAAARPGDLVITVGAGDVTRLGPVILADLAAREDRPSGLAPEPGR